MIVHQNQNIQTLIQLIKVIKIDSLFGKERREKINGFWPSLSLSLAEGLKAKGEERLQPKRGENCFCLG